MIKNMEKRFDFEKVGKQMPYKVPEGFFNELENNILAEVGAKPKHSYLRIVARSFAAAAAVVALTFTVINLTAEQTDGLNDILVSFNKLSTNDQEFLLDLYQDDMLMEYYNDYEY